MLRFAENRSQHDGRLKLVKPNDPILRTICRADFTIRRGDIDEMFDLMRQHGGLGLAAPQVGINARLFVTHWGEVFVNPLIVESIGSYLVVEGCLSLPGVALECCRYQQITMSSGQVYEGQEAQVIWHECDHLNGILITDRQLP